MSTIPKGQQYNPRSLKRIGDIVCDDHGVDLSSRSFLGKMVSHTGRGLTISTTTIIECGLWKRQREVSNLVEMDLHGSPLSVGDRTSSCFDYLSTTSSFFRVEGTNSTEFKTLCHTKISRDVLV